MAGDRDDEMARTATAPVGSAPAPAPADPVGATLGRYRLERELGAGGMGVVHAAFDPDLERRVALKVLRGAESADARQRLLREARAMAKLSHPNVVAVHEVGSAGGRDYVAMELVDGETLADWLRAEPRSEGDIVAAFVAAGRGLAAAHAAGLVHRDFKPHNVLRSRDGRILVTDFGLARGVEASPIALEVTLRPDQNTPSSLSGITATGSVLGTPAYMAPEQWSGKPVGPAADQFAFCVGLWEALTGERPFKGETIEELRKLIDRGVESLDVTKLPRRLRAPLSRGLDPDPARRFAKIDALLDALAPPRRRQVLPIAIGATLAAGAVAAFAFVVDRSPERAAAACPAPARDASSVWSATLASQLVSAGHPALARAIQRDVDAWHVIRGAACTGDRSHAVQLTCLDGVLARADAVRRAAATLHGDLGSDVMLEALVDPTVCSDSPPRLVIGPTPDVVEAFAVAGESRRPGTKLTARQALAVADRQGLDPCARGIVLLGAVSVAKGTAKRSAADAAVDAAEQCSDDRLRAEALLVDAPYHYEVPLVGPRGLEAIKKAQTAVSRVAQPDLVAGLDLQRGYVARQQSHWKEALDATEHARASFAARGDSHDELGAVLATCVVRDERSEVADMEEIRKLIATWRPRAIALGDREMAGALERMDARVRIALGDLEGGHEALMQNWRDHAGEREDDDAPKRAIEGVVVDRAGKPVAGATVASATTVVTDSIGVMPVGPDPNVRIVTTDADGHFAIPNAPARGSVLAQSGELRSLPVAVADKMRLVVEPTRRLAGKVDLRSRARTKTVITVAPLGVPPDAYRLVAPIRADGTFEVTGVPTGRVQIGTATSDGEAANLEFTLVEAGGPKTDLALVVSVSDRTVDVVARSAVALQLDTAQILLFPGRLRLTVVADLLQHIQLGGVQVQYGRQVVGEQIPKHAIDKVHSGDLVAHFTNVRDGELTACAVGLNGDLTDPAVERQIQAHRDELKFRCEPVGKTDHVVVVEAPPQKRFD